MSNRGRALTRGPQGFVANATGYWCFGTYYAGNAAHNLSSDTSTDGCYDVTAPGSANTTTTDHPTSTSIVLGNSIADIATVTSPQPFNNAGMQAGPVSFYLCGPTLTPVSCTTTTTTSLGSPNAFVNGAVYQPGLTIASPPSTGYWCFAAYYQGNSTHNASFDTSTNGCFDVTAPVTTTVMGPTMM